MPKYVKVASVKDIHENAGKLVTVNDVDIAIFKRNGVLYAINNVCAHQHFSMLHQGLLKELMITCPMHGWTYDLRTGRSTTGQGRVATYNIKVEGDDVLIEVSMAENV